MRGRWLMIGMVVVPLLVFYAIWLFYPIGYGFYHSFFDWNPLMKHNEYLGIGNYRTALFEDHLFWNGLLKAGYYTVATVPTQMMIGLLLAIMIYSLSRFQALYRTVYYLPVVTSMVAVSFIWKWMYQPRFGLITYILGVIGGWLGVRIPELYWLGNVRLAMPAIAIMSIWKGLGNTIIGGVPPILQRNRSLCHRLSIPDGHTPSFALIAGHPATHFKRAVRRHFVHVGDVH